MSASQQAILIVLVSYFTYKEWKAKKLEKPEIEQNSLMVNDSLSEEPQDTVTTPSPTDTPTPLPDDSSTIY